MRYYLVAGEASGDLHGANLMRALRQEDAEAEFRYYGGDKMRAQGGMMDKHYAEMAFMGFTEVVLNLRTILRNLKQCKKQILSYQPDVLILIDFPGFNLKIAEFAKAKGIKVCYYISPKVWAWNQKRALKIKRTVDRLFCILPFEVDFYKTWGMEVDYIGNPLLDEISLFEPDVTFKNKFDLGDRPLIALLPGSRRQEIERLLPDMLSVSANFPGYQFAVAATADFDLQYYQRFTAGKDVKLVFSSTYDLLNSSVAAIVASGTATLETALFKVPQVVVYKGGTLSIAIARMLIKIHFISLVNLIMDKKVVTELIQQECNPVMITAELKKIVQGASREKMLQEYKQLSEKMGVPGASKRAAELILQYFKH
ncbi:lipid-A-disaccharide synthase [Pedobacter faecalis]|uniref:lipid-A-disaccharide synthase n=1 Tax=Pedobacter faecalis TaxID=3041495 RepID=UPI00254CF401|nr:lipid-A-disaccharide synthase [Pedobacter sp. ELA7]